MGIKPHRLFFGAIDSFGSSRLRVGKSILTILSPCAHTFLPSPSCDSAHRSVLSKQPARLPDEPLFQVKMELAKCEEYHTKTVMNITDMRHGMG